MKDYDAVIIGAGQAAIPLARKLADKGWSVAIAERKHLGGSCVNFGCTPTKAVLASARVAHLARRAGEFGISVSGVGVDYSKVLDPGARDCAGIASGHRECARSARCRRPSRACAVCWTGRQRLHPAPRRAESSSQRGRHQYRHADGFAAHRRPLYGGISCTPAIG